MDLADDEEMMRMMHDARFESVFLGIETPDESSLETARKVQNTRNPLMQPWTDHGQRHPGDGRLHHRFD